MSNIDYVLRGYDIYKGNPKIIKPRPDPGFRHQIFKADYSKRVCSGDYRYQEPRGVKLDICRACAFDFHTRTISGEKSYLESLETKVTIENRFP